MFPATIGIPGLVILLLVVLILFGPSRLPQIGSAFGKTLSEFKKSTRELSEDEQDRISKPAE